MRHAAYLGVPNPEAGERAVLCVETASRLSEELCAALAAALDPMPVDDLVALERIPRDPRHRSKTDAGTLLALLERRLGAGGGERPRG